MALKIRVLALPPQSKDDLVAALVYTAEAYDDADPFREPRWTCAHKHDTPQSAHECGVAWLSSQGSPTARL